MNVKIIFLCKICQNSDMFLTIYISIHQLPVSLSLNPSTTRFYLSTICVSVRVSITVLQAGRSRFRFPMSLGFFIYLILPAALWPWVRLSL